MVNSGTDGRESTESDRHFARLERKVAWLDGIVCFPGTKFCFGLDAVIGLIPGIGDFVTMLVSLYLVYRFKKLGVSRGASRKMILNVLIDGLVGTIPVIGDIFDFRMRANTRNLELAKKELS